ncbi:MAG: transposase [Acidobacteria bacterium]|nr:transposase [Acidobacteriota bacterium]
MTYLTTLACYGCRLHGDESGSVDRGHNLHRNRLLEADRKRKAAEQRCMDQPPYSLDTARQAAVLRALEEVCTYRGWTLWAAHVRTNHVHAVVQADARPEKIMNDSKSYASRLLNRIKVDEMGRKRWARHGSTGWLWKGDHVSAASRYVLDEQGERMATFEALHPEVR